MRLSRQKREHPFGVALVPRFSEDLADRVRVFGGNGNHGVRRDDEQVGEVAPLGAQTVEDGVALAGGEQFREAFGIAFVRGFVHLCGENLKGQSEVLQNFAPTRGRRRENDIFHAFFAIAALAAATTFAAVKP